jgi:hypothetical protein
MQTPQKRTKTDNRFNVHIVPPMPFLQVEFEDFPAQMLCGEVKPIKLYFRNLAQGRMKNIKIASNFMSCLCFENPNSCAEVQIEKLHTENKKKTNSFVYRLDGLSLSPDDTYELNMWIYMPNIECTEQPIHFMFYYENDLVHLQPKKNEFK